MKLLTKSTYYFLLFSSITMIFAGIIFYYTLRKIVYNQIDESLVTEKTIIQDQIIETDSIPDFEASFGHLIEVRLLNYPVRTTQVIKDTTLNDKLPYRYIRYTATTPRNTGYIITIHRAVDEKNELIERIILGMFFLFVSLLLVSLVANYLVSKRVWNPFFETVNSALGFNVTRDDALQLPQTGIREFDQLNGIFEEMTRKMRSDYINLKEYNENASHEIQTPLAVIRSKMDILVQNGQLDEKSLELVRSVNEATARLTKLNQGLLLISKIENLQFPDTKKISFAGMVETCLGNYEEIMQLKGINAERDFPDPGIVVMNETLAEILISNLISNAVRYNHDNGFIRCRVDSRALTITNSGNPLDIDPEQLFNRFGKNSGNPHSVGLGLSIVKKIADFYKMRIYYSCTGDKHEITLTYNSGPQGND